MATCANEYIAYLNFLRERKDSYSEKEWYFQNGFLIGDIFEHVAEWKGVGCYPTISQLVQICEIKKLKHQPRNGKLHVMRQLLSTLLTEIQSLNPAYKPPNATTEG